MKNEIWAAVCTAGFIACISYLIYYLFSEHNSLLKSLRHVQTENISYSIRKGLQDVENAFNVADADHVEVAAYMYQAEMAKANTEIRQAKSPEERRTEQQALKWLNEEPKKHNIRLFYSK